MKFKMVVEASGVHSSRFCIITNYAIACSAKVFRDFPNFDKEKELG